MITDWYYSADHNEIGQVIEAQTVWGETICRVWLPSANSVVRIPASRLKPLDSAPNGSAEDIVYIATAARLTDTVAHDVLLAPIESSVRPLPHQLRALSRALSSDRVRYLLADEVGLGKTIEAGLILRELKLRGLIKRTLVVAPKGLATQWVSEMRFHFGENFQLLLPEDIRTLRRIAPVAASRNDHLEHPDSEALPSNAWQMFAQVVVPMDSVKPMDKRHGWSATQVSEYNRERFDDLISAGWDLVIVDEAHRLGGSTDQVARFRLGKGLSDAAPYLLLLSATPHQGKTDGFYRLISLIDSQKFPDVGSISRDRVQEYVIRTEKRHTIDAEGNPLFKPRNTQLAPTSWGDHHQDQQLLYEAVTDYVRDSYNQALREKRSYIGFLMILMQRLVVSSTRAIRTTLERRLEVLAEPQEQQLTLFPLSEEEWLDLDGQEQMETMLRTRLKALKNERAQVMLLLEAASRCEQSGPDAKAEALLEWLYRLQSEERAPDLKVLIFTEFVPTQEMLVRFLEDRGFSVVCLNGSLEMGERKRVQEAFAREVRILISTDAGGEGLNLQFCHVVINYDIPWNPMRLEQRIGRVDRIGQDHIVRAINFVFEGSVEYRVQQVLEEKLTVIFEEFGIDKTGDVLDSAQAGRMFGEMYVEAILNPDKVEDSVATVVSQLREQARETRATDSLFGATEDLDPTEVQRLLSHPLPHWVERMTVAYIKGRGGKAERAGSSWNLCWPSGERSSNVVFTNTEAAESTTAQHLTLEDPKVRSLTMKLPRFVPGQPVPQVSIPGIGEEIQGLWSLWRIAIATIASNRGRVMPLFLADSGKVLMPTARYVWDQLLTTNPHVRSMLGSEASKSAFALLQTAAELHGKPLYEALAADNQALLKREHEKAEYTYIARRNAIQRIGLPQVRSYRLKLLAQEELNFRAQLAQRAEITPEMVPLLIVQVEGT